MIKSVFLNVFVLKAPVSESTNPKLDEKKEQNKTDPSNTSSRKSQTVTKTLAKNVRITQGLLN